MLVSTRSTMHEPRDKAPLRKRMTVLALTCGLIAVGSPALAESLQGEWARGDGKAKVRIEPCGSDVCAINTWIKPGTTKEKTGDRLVMSIRPEQGGGWAGTAFDPQRNMTYRLTISVTQDRMTTRGCIVAGLICRAVSWSRLN